MKEISQELKEVLYNKLPYKKLEINYSKSPVEMDLFLSFLLVPTERSIDHLGYSNGWTKLENKELKLIIGGGIVNSKEYLDTIQFGINLCNPYNNFVNPFYLFPILSEAGKQFFVKYYSIEIEGIVNNNKNSISHLEESLALQKEVTRKIIAEVELLNQINL